MKYKLNVRYIHELGKRSCQEDYIYPKAGVARPDDSLFIVCDGMGGTEGGEVASRIVAETLGSILHSCAQFDVSVFNRALACACDELDLHVSGPLRSMGTTLALVKFYDAGCFVAHVGDSRVYHIRPSMPAQQRVLFVTRDHSLVNELVDLGQITPEQARSHPRRNVITRALMPLQKARAEADVNMISDVRSGDYFYLCSDGMLEISSDMEIANVISMQDKTDDEKVAILREVTRDNKDNHSAILIHVLEA